MSAELLDRPSVVAAEINYCSANGFRPRFYGNDHARDVLGLDPHVVPIMDTRTLRDAPALDAEGFQIFRMRSAVTDWRDSAHVAEVHVPEVRRFVLELTGADDVVVLGRAITRFSRRSVEAGQYDNSQAAGFIHIDVSDPTARDTAAKMAPGGRSFHRAVQHNIWRTFSGAPQDMPLALCDARTVQPRDLVFADAVFDPPGAAEWTFEAMLLRHNPSHRWLFYSNMTPDEVLVFQRHDSDAARSRPVPHTAFVDPSIPDSVPPRASVELRTVAYWFD